MPPDIPATGFILWDFNPSQNSSEKVDVPIDRFKRHVLSWVCSREQDGTKRRSEADPVKRANGDLLENTLRDRKGALNESGDSQGRSSSLKRRILLVPGLSTTTKGGQAC